MLPVPLIDCVPLYCSALLLRVTVVLLRVSPPLRFTVPLTFSPVDSATLVSVPLFALSAVPLLEDTAPPLSDRLLVIVATPPPVASEFAFRTRFNLPTPVALMLPLRLMLLCAVKVSDTSLALLVVMALASVMSPACVFAPAVDVVMVTLMPAFSAA